MYVIDGSPNRESQLAILYFYPISNFLLANTQANTSTYLRTDKHTYIHMPMYNPPTRSRARTVKHAIHVACLKGKLIVEEREREGGVVRVGGVQVGRGRNEDEHEDDEGEGEASLRWSITQVWTVVESEGKAEMEGKRWRGNGGAG